MFGLNHSLVFIGIGFIFDFFAIYRVLRGGQGYSTHLGVFDVLDLQNRDIWSDMFNLVNHLIKAAISKLLNTLIRTWRYEL